MPLKRLVTLRTDRAAGRSFAVALENIEGWSGQFVEGEGSYEGEGTAFEAGDILFGKLRPYLAKAWLADRAGEAVGDFHVLRRNGDHNSRFLQRVLLSREMISLIDGSTYGAKMPRASWDFMGMLPVPVPPQDEQSAIAAFLDRECGKIDALVAEQERLMALLKEKRQAVISHAVTKGLDPNAPMKPSGVEWLGEVPEHWDVMRIKRMIRSLEQGWSPQCEGFPVVSSDEWVVLKVGCVNGGRFNPEENKTLPANLEPIPELALAANDVLISRANTRELVGGAALVPIDFPNLLLCDKLYRLRLHEDICNPKLLAVYLGSDVARGQIELAATGASQSMVNIGQGTILELAVPLPPILEQRDIVSYIDAETARLADLTAEANHAIALLKERRAALISAAVTGKIDVRGLLPKEAAA